MLKSDGVINLGLSSSSSCCWLLSFTSLLFAFSMNRVGAQLNTCSIAAQSVSHESQLFYGRIDFVMGVILFRYPAQAYALLISALLNE
jgi:hypothetical protein